MQEVQITFTYEEPDGTLDTLIVTVEWDGTLETFPGRSLPTAVSGVVNSAISPHDGVLIPSHRIRMLEWTVL